MLHRNAPLSVEGRCRLIAEEREPRVTFWGEEEGLHAGAWNLRLCLGYDPVSHCVEISAGVAVDTRLRDSFDDRLGYSDSFEIQLANWADSKTDGDR
jgi:hypothetical protein